MNTKRAYAYNYLKYTLITHAGVESEEMNKKLSVVINRLQNQKEKLGQETCDKIDLIVNDFFVANFVNKGQDLDETFKDLNQKFSETVKKVKKRKKRKDRSQPN